MTGCRCTGVNARAPDRNPAGRSFRACDLDCAGKADPFVPYAGETARREYRDYPPRHIRIRTRIGVRPNASTISYRVQAAALSEPFRENRCRWVPGCGNIPIDKTTIPAWIRINPAPHTQRLSLPPELNFLFFITKNDIANTGLSNVYVLLDVRCVCMRNLDPISP